jgi:hypothetical protein
LQQASKTIEGLGVFSLEKGNFHQTFGSYYRWKSDWGMGNEKMDAVRGNLKSEPIYISQGNLALCLEQLSGHDKIKWGHQWLI